MKRISFSCPCCGKDSDLSITYLKLVPGGVLNVVCPGCSEKFNIPFEFYPVEDENDQTKQ